MKRTLLSVFLPLLLLCLCLPAAADESFASAPDMASYLFDCVDRREESIAFTLTGAFALTDDAELEEMLDDICSKVNWRAYTFERSGSRTDVSVRLWYRPGVRMLDAWRSGNTDALTSDEIACLQKAESILAQLRGTAGSDLKMEKAIHDYLCRTITYTAGESLNATDGVTTATWALLRGTANCQGYSDAFYLLGNMAGLDVDFMCGLDGTQEHIWNVIRLDGKQYIVDVTHDDPDEDWDEPKYTYFNIGLDLLPSDRKWYAFAIADPVSMHTSDDLFYFNGDKGFGRVFFSLEEAAQYCYEHALEGAQYVHFAVYRDEVTSDEINTAISNTLFAHPDATNWTYLYDYRGNHSFVLFRWNEF